MVAKEGKKDHRQNKNDIRKKEKLEEQNKLEKCIRDMELPEQEFEQDWETQEETKQPIISEIPQDTKFRYFRDQPQSKPTLDGQDNGKYKYMTRVQSVSIPYSLRGDDIVGGACTGSGKTLAYLVPMMEKLYREEIKGPEQGLAAQIITPTRELAAQIFQVLLTIGSKHSFSAGTVIGGKDTEKESKMIHAMNIIIGTPGRQQHHQEKTKNFIVDGQRILIFDEVDRILSMGFQEIIKNIIEYLPKYPQVQTLLFSATPTNEVQKYSQRQQNKPKYILINILNDTITPTKLIQTYMVCDASEKINILYSFQRTHQNNKIQIFLTSNKQVRYIYEIFRRQRPGIPLLHIHGRMDQQNRQEIYNRFCERKTNIAMFCTSLTSRGLDFPKLDWIVQFDIPMNTEEYIHRVGRTARYKSSGNSQMLVLKSEKKFIDHQIKIRVPIKRVKYKKDKLQDITKRVQDFLIENSELKFLAQKAFITYIRSIYLNPDKDVFVIEKVNGPGLAKSMGLPGVPQIQKFRGSMDYVKNMPYEQKRLLEQKQRAKRQYEGELKHQEHHQQILQNLMNKKDATKMEKMLIKKNDNVLSSTYDRMRVSSKNDTKSSDDDEQFILRDRSSINVDSDDGSSNTNNNDQCKPTPKEIKKKLKKDKRKKEQEDRLEKGILKKDMKILDENDIHIVDKGSFINEQHEGVKQKDPYDKKIMHERVQSKHRKYKKLRREEIAKTADTSFTSSDEDQNELSIN